MSEVSLRPARRAGVISLYIFALAAYCSTALANAALVLMTLAFLADIARAWPRWRREPLLLCFGLFVLALAVSSIAAALRSPGEIMYYAGTAGSLLALWFFVPVAWWLEGDARRLLRILGLALVGFVVGRLVHVDWARPLAFLHARDGLGLPAIAFGEYCAAALLGLILMAPRLWRTIRSSGARVAAAALWLVLAFAALEGLVGSQSRGAWLAFVVALPVGLLIRFWRRIIALSPAARIGWFATAAAAVVLVAAVAYWANPRVIQHRLSQEHGAVDAALIGDFADVGHGSIGTRIHIWVFGLEHWWEKPVFGWGPGANHRLLKTQGGSYLSHFQDAHNAYVGILIDLGVLGFVVLAGTMTRIFRLGVIGGRRGIWPADLHGLVAAGLVLHLMAAITNYRLTNVDWQFYWILFVAPAVSFGMRGLTTGSGARERTEPFTGVPRYSE